MAAEYRQPQSDLALPGFAALLRKEMIDARRSKRLIVFAAVMTLALLSIVTAVGADEDRDRFLTDAEVVETMLGTWAGIVAYLGSFMIIAATIDPVTRERSLGITSWIITKPVSRLSYLASIATGHIIAGIATIVVIPSVPILLITLLWFQQLPVPQVLAALLVLSVEIAFLTVLNVALGVIFRSVTPVLLVSLAVWFIPTIVPAFEALRWTINVLPAYLPVAAIVAAAQPEGEWMVLTVPLFAIIFGAIMFWIAAELFERQEL